MPLNKTPVYRNLGTRVTFLHLEYEDLIAVLLIAPVAFFLGSLFDRELFGIPMKLVFQLGIPATTVVLLLTFKYGKPRRYLFDFIEWHTKPRIYCGVERDAQQSVMYMKEDEPECP